MKKYCKYCKLEIEVKNGQTFGGHIASCKSHPNRLDIDKKNSLSHFKEKVHLKLNCVECGNEFEIDVRPGIYKRNKYKKCCSQRCSHIRHLTEDSRNQISIALKGKPFSGIRGRRKIIPLSERICKNPNCNKSFFTARWRTKKYCNPKCAAWNSGGLRCNCHKKGSWYFCKWMNKDVYLDSTWEREYVIWLDLNNIEWYRPSYFNWVDENNKTHKYYPDFYLKNEDVYIDIKNDFLIKRHEFKISQVLKLNSINLKIVSRKQLDEILASVV